MWVFAWVSHITHTQPKNGRKLSTLLNGFVFGMSLMSRARLVARRPTSARRTSRELIWTSVVLRLLALDACRRRPFYHRTFWVFRGVDMGLDTKCRAPGNNVRWQSSFAQLHNREKFCFSRLPLQKSVRAPSALRGWQRGRRARADGAGAVLMLASAAERSTMTGSRNRVLSHWHRQWIRGSSHCETFSYSLFLIRTRQLLCVTRASERNTLSAIGTNAHAINENSMYVCGHEKRFYHSFIFHFHPHTVKSLALWCVRWLFSSFSFVFQILFLLRVIYLHW